MARVLPRPDLRTPILAADLGASKILAGVVRGTRIVARARRDVPKPSRPWTRVAERLLDALRELEEPGFRAAAVGLGVAGQVDPETGVVRHAPNLRWRDVPLGRFLERETRLPVFLANDVRAITVGEWRFGAGRSARNLLCLNVGTGVGGGAVVDGRLLDGASHATGEVGHIVVERLGRKCSCPGSGCLEAYVGGWAIAARAREAARRNPRRGRRLRELAGGNAGIDARTVEDALARGDPLAREIVAETADRFAQGVVSLVNALNPERVVVGGTIAERFPRLIHEARRAVRRSCQPPAARAVTIVPSALGHDAALFGAAELARWSLTGRREG